MAHSLSRTNLTIKNLYIKDGYEKTDYILVSDSRGMANWRKPSNYIADKPNDHYIGELFGGGVVVAVWQENGIEKCLVSATENISSVRYAYYRPPSGGFAAEAIIDYGFQWGLVDLGGGAYAPIGATYNSFGASNSNIIGSYTHPTAPVPYFAAERCLDYYNPDLGTGVWDDWFMPSILELNHLISNTAIFNKVLESFASDTGRAIRDVVSNDVGFDWANTTSLTLTDINLVDLSGTKYTTHINEVLLFDGQSYTVTTTSNDYTGGFSYYLSSTERGGPGTLAISTSTNFGYVLNPVEIHKASYGAVRPFRIADDTQKNFKFDADYLVISYQFTDGRDLDTRTRMIYPTNGVTPYNASNGYVNGVNGGPFAANSIGWSSPRPWMDEYNSYDYTPGITSSIPAPVGRYNPPGTGNNVKGTYSILRSAGDNLQTGFESIILSTDAFRHHFPGESEIIVDCRAWWQGASGSNPVVLNVVMYKGGEMIRKSSTGSDYFVWINPTAGASYSIDSYGKILLKPSTSFYPGDSRASDRVARLKYNVVGKFGYLIID